MEFVRRKASGLEYTLEQSTTLLEGSFAPVDLGPAQADDIDDFWERVWLEVDYDAVTDPKGFLRARCGCREGGRSERWMNSARISNEGGSMKKLVFKLPRDIFRT